MANFVPVAAPVLTGQWKTDRACMILFHDKCVILRKQENGTYALPPAEAVPHSGEALLVGRAELPFYAAELEELPEVDHLEAVPIRSAADFVQADDFSAICRAKELLHWRRQHRFCGHCGRKLEESGTDAALICPNCGEHYYPQIAPAVIVAVTRGNEILLAHNKRFQAKIHGLIAGFVEAGESVEQAINREILEETGITVRNIRYFSSQCWPFPNSLMLGFFAEYESGEAKADGEELETLGWFTADALPEIPPPGSIARRIIDAWRSKS